MTYFTDGKHVFCSHKPDMPFEFCYSLPKEGEILFLFRRLPLTGRETFAVSDTGVMTAIQDEALLSTLERPELDVPPDLAKAVAQGRVRGINLCHPRFEELLELPPSPQRHRVHLLAPEDAGGALLQELCLMGGDVISAIGICGGAQQWELEANRPDLPPVETVEPENLFDCDLFLLCASGVEADAQQVAAYAGMAREKQYKGKFWVVGDGAAPLCKTALTVSNRDKKGKTDYLGLMPHQIRGFDPGTRNDRANSDASHILSALRGEWHCSSVFLGGVFLGCRNRDAENGPDIERLPLPTDRMARIRETADRLRAINL